MKLMAKVAALAATLTLLFGGVAQAASSTTTSPRNTGETAAVASSGETQAIVVAGVAFVLMIGTAGAVLWYTARGRRVSSDTSRNGR